LAVTELLLDRVGLVREPLDVGVLALVVDGLKPEQLVHLGLQEVRLRQGVVHHPLLFVEKVARAPVEHLFPQLRLGQYRPAAPAALPLRCRTVRGHAGRCDCSGGSNSKSGGGQWSSPFQARTMPGCSCDVMVVAPAFKVRRARSCAATTAGMRLPAWSVARSSCAASAVLESGRASSSSHAASPGDGPRSASSPATRWRKMTQAKPAAARDQPPASMTS